MRIDYRNRWGRNWITTVRNQGASQNCWAFAFTALCEAMLRIEHQLWTRRSEGEIGRGAGKQPWDIGNFSEASIFVERYGLADPDCFPWSEASALYTAKPHMEDLSALAMAPTPDRVGRMMKLQAGQTIGVSTSEQKQRWLREIGPMATLFELPPGFRVYRGGAPFQHVKDSQIGGGGHAVLVIGFDDIARTWIVKNSYGPGWGSGGFGELSWDAIDRDRDIARNKGILEGSPFVGLRGTNPDPWSRRRMRTGSFLQSGNGAGRNNFEAFLRVGRDVVHFFRDNSTFGNPWVEAGPVRSADPDRGTFGDDVVDHPSAIQSSFNRSFDLMVRTSHRFLRHVHFDQTSKWWSDLSIFGPMDPVGMPGFIQSNRGAPGDFEVVAVNPRGQAEHWAKHNGAP